MKSLNEVEMERPKQKGHDLNKLKELLLKDEEIQMLVEGLDIDQFLVNLIDYKICKEKCAHCQGLESCEQQTRGLKQLVTRYPIYLDFTFDYCDKQKAYMKTKNLNLKALHIPEKALSARLDDLINDPKRAEILEYVNRFTKEYNEGNFMKGLYLYGKPGRGKTFILCALAKELSLRGLSVIIVYYPDLVRELKQSAFDGTLHDKISTLKKIDVLMLDDIGAEKVTEYSRDELLGSILQYRMTDERPTFFSSNLDIAELVKHLSTDESSFNQMKGIRIVERIKTLAMPMELDGERYRK